MTLFLDIFSNQDLFGFQKIGGGGGLTPQKILYTPLSGRALSLFGLVNQV